MIASLRAGPHPDPRRQETTGISSARPLPCSAGLSPRELEALPGLVRIDGPFAACEEAYPDFQFAPTGGIIPGLREVVCAVEESLDCLSLAAFLTASHPHLGGASIVDELCTGHEADTVIATLLAA